MVSDASRRVDCSGVAGGPLLDSYSVTGAHGARMILDSEGQAVVVQLEDGCE